MSKSLQVLLGLLAASTVFSSVASLDLSSANWIWTSTGRDTSGSYSAGYATFRRDFFAPAGKTPLSASFVIAADDRYQLFYNGDIVGNGASYNAAQRYCVAMSESGPSVFSVIAQNTGGAAGLLAAVEVRYMDGTNDTLVTDGAWRAVEGNGFLDVLFDDSLWPAAYVQGAFPLTAPWYGQVSVPVDLSLPLVSATVPAIQTANWIWTNDYEANVIGARHFRKTVTIPAGQFVDSMVMDIVADDAYTLYVNGMLVGSGTSYMTAQRWRTRFAPTSSVVIVVYAYNGGGPAGLLASGVLQSCACGCGYATTFQTDESWKSKINPSPGYVNPTYDVDNWDTAVIEGAYGVAPWGNIPTPTAVSLPNGAIVGAPDAPPAFDYIA